MVNEGRNCDDENKHSNAKDLVHTGTGYRPGSARTFDLGIVRAVNFSLNENGEEAEVVITPTYSGCPAMDVIRTNIRLALIGLGF